VQMQLVPGAVQVIVPVTDERRRAHPFSGKGRTET
jgi:hypothetical protein